LRTRAAARNKRLGQAGISIGGSLTRILRKCGKKQCRCAENPGFRHEAYLLTWKEKGKTNAQYVSVDMVKEVRDWIRERKRIKKLLAEIDSLALKILKAHAAKNRAEIKKKTLLK
jgi:hypothetical protein